MLKEQKRTPVRRARRYPFAAYVELTDLESEAHFEEITNDVSLFGCSVATTNSLPIGAKVRLRITHRGCHFTALGRIVYVRPYLEMGIVFTQVEDNDQATLEKWVSELRSQKWPFKSRRLGK